MRRLTISNALDELAQQDSTFIKLFSHGSLEVEIYKPEKVDPAKDHLEGYQLVHDHFLGKTVHAGEDYGPESIFQAITDCHADRIGHGTWIFSPRKIQDDSIQDRGAYVEKLVRYVADRRITLEVCLTSNQQTIPEFRNALHKHPFGRMRRERLSVTLCTDNRLVSRTTITDEVMKAVETFHLKPKALKELLTYGFKRSFFPGPYHVKRASPGSSALSSSSRSAGSSSRRCSPEVPTAYAPPAVATRSCGSTRRRAA